jgi:RNA polymerase sigma-32 factor
LPSRAAGAAGTSGATPGDGAAKTEGGAPKTDSAPKASAARPAKAAKKPSARAEAARQARERQADEDEDDPSSERPPRSSDDEDEEQESDEGADRPGEVYDAEPVADAAAELVDADAEEGEGTFEEEDHGSSGRAYPKETEEASNRLALNRSDPLQAYLREVQRHPLLTPEEEQTLAQRYNTTQDVSAAARLVTANLRLVVKIAYEYRRAFKNIMDLIQEGNIGLMQAVKKYDPNRGVKLSSYSAWWIRAYILRYIINNWRLVKLGTTQAQRKLFFNLNKEKAKLSAMGIDPTPTEIAKRLGVEEQEAIDMDRRLSSGEMSLDAPVGDNEGRPVSRIELLPSSNLGPDSMVADEELGDIVREKLAEFRTTLKGKDISIFDKRLMSDEPLTLQELGDEFGISRERVRQIEARLTMNLRNFLQAALGDAVDPS